MKDVSATRNKRTERPWYKPSIELISSANIENVRTLEVGCGLCEFSLKLKKKGFDVTCIDGSLNYVEKARKLGFKSKRVDFNERLPFKDKEFEFVSCLEVIEHIENAENLVKESNRVLKEMGYFLISTPNFSFLGLRLAYLLGSVPPDEGYHFRFFNYKTLKKLLNQNGFEIIKMNSISFSPLYRLFRGYKPRSIKVKYLQNLLASKLIFLCKKV